MGYFDEDQNDSIINDAGKIKGTYDNAKSVVDTAKQVKDYMDSQKALKGAMGASDASKAKSATDVAKAAKTGAEAAKTASTVANGAKAASTAAKIAAGAASGPAGWAALAASLATSKTGKKVIWLAIALPIVFLIIIFMVILAPVIIVYEKASEVYQDGKAQLELYDNYYSVGKVNFNDADDFWNHIYEEYKGKINPEDIHSQTDLYGAEAEMNFNICKEIIDNAIDWAFKAPRDDGTGGYWTMFCKSDTWLGKFFESTWDWLVHDNENNNSYESFMDAQYPYTLGEESIVTLKSGKLGNHTYYTIKNYMDGEIPDAKLNNDINYVEIINAVSLGMPNGQFTFLEFYNKLMDSKVRRNFAELSCSEYYYLGKDSKTEERSLTDLAVKNGLTVDELLSTKNVTGYLKYDVYPYGLEDIFEVAGVRADEASYVMYPRSNYQVLDEYENIYRRNLAWLNLDMGIGFQEERSSLSKAYKNYLSDIASTTGRSAYNYVDKTSMLYGEVMQLEEWDLENAIYDTIIYSPTGKSKILDFNSNAETSANNKLAVMRDPNFERDYSSDGTTHSFYICQLDYPYDYRGPREDNSTIANEGCTDSCYTMAAQYLLNRDISIRAVSKAFCVDGYFKSGGTFNSDGVRTNADNSAYMLDYFDLYQIMHYGSFDQTKVVASLDNGSPCIFVIYGSWKYGGTVYHRGVAEGANSNTTHFIIIIGYDDNGFYVLDPANRNRIKIPYKAFETANITSWRLIGDTTQSDGSIFTWVSKARFAYSKSGDDHIYVNGYDTGIESQTGEAVGYNTSEKTSNSWTEIPPSNTEIESIVKSWTGNP